ncbi:MAG: succinate dehydrogenase/fumarate reductase iron-sulfur subunit [Phycisphaera sp.]|nr:succinate dehydrogenase/fumarate reductase iron-sulfur subunit [Phycisphaera sp.]
MAEEKTIKLEIFRYNPETDDEPYFDTFDVPFKEDWVVLDAINWIKDHVDGTISHRWSCRMGVCGSCGMMVNGDPKLTCAAFLKDYMPGPIRVEPLANFPVERDLIIDFDPFMEKLTKVKPYIIRKNDDVNDPTGGEYLQSPADLALFKQYSMCINCMLCYAACPVLGHEPSFMGPAAIALGHRYNLDSRDEGTYERLDIMTEHDAVWGCTFVGECSVVCPKHVDPAGAIQGAKLSAALHSMKLDIVNEMFVFPKGAGK